MAGWHVLEKYLEETGAHSTLVGKYWITLFLALRLLTLVAVSEVGFGEDYKGNTKIVRTAYFESQSLRNSIKIAEFRQGPSRVRYKNSWLSPNVHQSVLPDSAKLLL